MAVGYSKRSLADKLGVKPGMRLIVLGAPAAYSALLGPLPARASLSNRLADHTLAPRTPAARP